MLHQDFSPWNQRRQHPRMCGNPQSRIHQAHKIRCDLSTPSVTATTRASPALEKNIHTYSHASRRQWASSSLTLTTTCALACAQRPLNFQRQHHLQLSNHQQQQHQHNRQHRQRPRFRPSLLLKQSTSVQHLRPDNYLPATASLNSQSTRYTPALNHHHVGPRSCVAVSPCLVSLPERCFPTDSGAVAVG